MVDRVFCKWRELNDSLDVSKDCPGTSQNLGRIMGAWRIQ